MSSIPRPHHRGFTMVELLVVIAIIVLLMSLTVGAMFSFIAGARESATATTITKVNQQLQERIANFRQMDFTDAAQRYSTANSVSIELAEIIVRKYRMKRAFPQNLSEAFGNDPTRFVSLSVLSSPPASYVPKFESGIVLYALLVNGETFGAPSASDDLFSSSEIRISAETANLPCLVDAWGEPLRFYRWPTRLFKPDGSTVDRTYARLLVASVGPVNGYGADGLPGAGGVGGVGAYGSDDVPNNGPDGQPGIAGAGPLGAVGSDDFEPLNVDADDPLLLLYTYLTPALAMQFEQGTTSPPPPNLSQALHTPFTYNPMLVVSAGPDRQLGLFEPSNAANFGYLACPTLSVPQLTDNLTNLNLSSSGK